MGFPSRIILSCAALSQPRRGKRDFSKATIEIAVLPSIGLSRVMRRTAPSLDETVPPNTLVRPMMRVALPIMVVEDERVAALFALLRCERVLQRTGPCS